MRVRILLQALLTLQNGIYSAAAPGSREQYACHAVRVFGGWFLPALPCYLPAGKLLRRTESLATRRSARRQQL